MVGFISGGATEEIEEGSGPPPFILGMIEQFTVE